MEGESIQGGEMKSGSGGCQGSWKGGVEAWQPRGFRIDEKGG